MARGVSMRHRDFLRGHEQRERMRRAWFTFFQDWDVLLCPVAAGTAMPHDQAGERWQRTIEVNGRRVPVVDQMFWAGVSGFFGLPSTVAPLGMSAAGLPFGVQIVGPQYGDRTTILVAKLLETCWQGFVSPPAGTERHLRCHAGGTHSPALPARSPPTTSPSSPGRPPEPLHSFPRSPLNITQAVTGNVR